MAAFNVPISEVSTLNVRGSFLLNFSDHMNLYTLGIGFVFLIHAGKQAGYPSNLPFTTQVQLV